MQDKDSNLTYIVDSFEFVDAWPYRGALSPVHLSAYLQIAPI